MDLKLQHRDIREIRDALFHKCLTNVVSRISKSNPSLVSPLIKKLGITYESCIRDIDRRSIDISEENVGVGSFGYETRLIPSNPQDNIINSIAQACDVSAVKLSYENNGETMFFGMKDNTTREQLFDKFITTGYESEGFTEVESTASTLLDDVKEGATPFIESLAKYVLSLMKQEQNESFNDETNEDDQFGMSEVTPGDEEDENNNSADPFGGDNTNDDNGDSADPFGGEGGGDNVGGDSADPFGGSGDNNGDNNNAADPFGDSSTGDDNGNNNSADPFGDSSTGDNNNDNSNPFDDNGGGDNGGGNSSADPFGSESVEIKDDYTVAYENMCKNPNLNSWRFTIGTESYGTIRDISPFDDLDVSDLLSFSTVTIKDMWKDDVEKCLKDFGNESAEFNKMSTLVKNSGKALSETLVKTILTLGALGIKTDIADIKYN